jgi:pyruvate dehydrogenase phosphatase
MVTPDEAGDDWVVERLTTDHNGDNDAEVERVQRAHPGEPECVIDRRVLGALAPFRCTFDLVFSRSLG